MKPDCKGTRLRWRTAAVIPVAVLAWAGVGMTTGTAFAASANAQSSANGNGNNASNGNGNGNGNGSANANANSAAASMGATANPTAGDSSKVAPGQAKKQDAGSTGAPSSSSSSSSSVANSNSNGNGNGNASSHSSQGNSGTSGDPTKPQPPSNADQNKGGANNGGNCGAYCSTRDGSPSKNGNGNGKATGKPCAGCVGKADNKNPKGQRPNGNDHNKGYECDGNHGIGKGNPAHTACTTPPPGCTHDCNPCPNGHQRDANGSCGGGGCTTNCNPCPNGQPRDANGSCGHPDCHATKSCGGGGDCHTVGNCPGGGDCHSVGNCPGGGGCKATHSCKPPKCVPSKANNFCSTVKAKVHHKTSKPPTVVLGEKVTKTPTALPFTGAPVAAMLTIGLLTLMLGGLLLLAGSRRNRETTVERLRTIQALFRARPVQAPVLAAASGRWSESTWPAALAQHSEFSTAPRFVLRRLRVRRRPRA